MKQLWILKPQLMEPLTLKISRWIEMNAVIPASVNKWNAWSASGKKQYVLARLILYPSEWFQFHSEIWQPPCARLEGTRSLDIVFRLYREGLSLSRKQANSHIQEANLKRTVPNGSFSSDWASHLSSWNLKKKKLNWLQVVLCSPNQRCFFPKLHVTKAVLSLPFLKYWTNEKI